MWTEKHWSTIRFLQLSSHIFHPFGLKQITYYDFSDFDNQWCHNMILIISDVITKMVDWKFLKASIRPSIKFVLFVCCSLTYPLLTPLPKTFWALLENNFFFALFLTENTIFPLRCNEWKNKTMKKKVFVSYLLTYPSKIYRIGVQQTNYILRMA